MSVSTSFYDTTKHFILTYKYVQQSVSTVHGVRLRIVKKFYFKHKDVSGRSILEVEVKRWSVHSGVIKQHRHKQKPLLLHFSGCGSEIRAQLYRFMNNVCLI